MSESKRKVVELLAEKAYTGGPVVLTSGAESGVYLDAKTVTHHPDGAGLVGEAVLEKLEGYDVDAIGGLATGANAIISNVVLVASAQGRFLPGFFVRETAKEHGLQKRIEGTPLSAGQSVAVVDDVVTSGGSVEKAIDALEEAGVRPAVVVALVDREEGGRERIEARGIPFEAVCTLHEVSDRAERGSS